MQMLRARFNLYFLDSLLLCMWVFLGVGVVVGFVGSRMPDLTKALITGIFQPEYLMFAFFGLSVFRLSENYRYPRYFLPSSYVFGCLIAVLGTQEQHQYPWFILGIPTGMVVQVVWMALYTGWIRLCPRSASRMRKFPRRLQLRKIHASRPT